MPAKRGKKKPAKAAKAAKKTAPAKKKAMYGLDEGFGFTGPLTIEICGEVTLEKLEESISAALVQNETDILADPVTDTLFLTLQHQVGPKPPPCPPFCPDEKKKS